jgi:diacylglycerol kinase (ATP)
LYTFIVNKVSGNGRALNIWNDIEKILQTKKVNYHVFFTEQPKHATKIAQDLSSGKETGVVIVIGGDGTVHEVVNGLVGSSIPLGIIPAGSGNDLARALGIPTAYKEALDRIFQGKQRTVDIGRIGGKCCTTVIGIGFDGKVAQTVNQSKLKKWLNFFRLGKLTYIISVFQVLFNYEPTDVTLKIDKNEWMITKVWLIAVANFPFYAGGMVICPNAKGNDGLFELCVIHGISKWELLRIFPGVFKGKHIYHPSVIQFTGKQVEIASSSAMIVHGDGEMIGQTPIKINIEENALHVV